MFIGYVTLAIMVVSIGIAIACWIHKALAKENKAEYQTRKFDYVFDSVERDGLTTNVMYKSALDNLDKVGDINAAKQWKWVILCYTTDEAAGSPIIADENGDFFKAVNGDNSKIDGYQRSVRDGEKIHFFPFRRRALERAV